MARTKQGIFDERYPHIDAPTVQDETRSRGSHIRKLCIPIGTLDDVKKYRNEKLYYLSSIPWMPRRKLDGENIRIKWDGEQALWSGKTNNFVCSSDFSDYMNTTFLEEIFEEKFGREKTVLLFGEKMGPKTQGNELGLEKDEVILFDVCLNGTWLKDENVREISRYFGIKHCSDYSEDLGQADLNTLIQDVFKGKFSDWEGLVAVPLYDIRDSNGERFIVKIKNKDYKCMAI